MGTLVGPLQRFRRHVAVIGKFSLENDPEKRIIHTDYGGAREELRRRLAVYSWRDNNTTVGDLTMRLVSLGEAGRAVTVDDPNGIKELPVGGTALEDVIEGGEDVTAAGGRLFVELLNALDGALPFSHPNFDLVLTEAFVRFYTAPYRTGVQYLPEGALRRVMLEPEINTRLLALLRGGEEVAAVSAYADSLRAALCIRADGPGSMAGPLRRGHVELIVEELLAFRECLDTEEASAELERLDDERLNDLLRSAKVPHRGSEQVVEGQGKAGAKIQSLYRVFHQHRRIIDRVATNEAVFSLLIAWALSKFGKSDEEKSKALWNRIGVAKGIKAQTRDEVMEGHREHFDVLRRKFDEAIRDEKVRSALEPLLTTVQDAREAEYGSARVFERDEACKFVAAIAGKLAALTVEGMPECAASLVAAVKEQRQDFYKFEMVRSEELTAATLKGVFGAHPVVEEVADTGTEGLVLAGEFETRFREFESDREVQILKQLADRQGRALRKRVSGVEETTYRLVRELVPEAGDVPTAAPGGALAGSVGREVLAEGVESPAGKEDLARRERRLSAGAGKEDSSGARTEDGSSGGESSGRENGQEGMSIEVAAMAVDVGRAEEKEGKNGGDGEEVKGGHPFLKPPRERARAEGEQKQQLLESALFGADEKAGERGLLERSRVELAEYRAMARARLLGMHMLGVGRTRSPIGEEDVSVGAHFVLRMVEAIGGTAELERDRERLRGRGVDLDCVKKMNIAAIVRRFVPLEEAQAVPEIEKFVSGWENAAKAVVGLREWWAEWKAVGVVLDGLGGCGVRDGRVTLFNETVTEHAERVKAAMEKDGRPGRSAVCWPKENGEMAGVAMPPGIVYVAGEAGSAGAIAKLLVEDNWGPLYGGGIEAGTTVVQGADSKFLHEAIWGIPVVVRRGVEDRKEGEEVLPVIAIGGLEPFGAILGLAGLRPRGEGPWELAVGVAAKEEFQKAGARGVWANTRAQDAWVAYLRLDRQLAAQCESRVLTHALVSRVSELTEPAYEQAVNDMWEDLIETYGNGREKGVAEMLSGLLKVENKEGELVAIPRRGRARPATRRLRVGEWDATRIAEWFSRM